MAVIHHTVLKPTKLELLTAWLPSRAWYSGGAEGPGLVRAGGFRLDDPEGEVGIEFIVVTDTSGDRPATHLVPLTYRGAPLDGAEHALVGTMEHGVLGQRWVYDGCHDPVLAAQLLALIQGTAEAQAQSVSDTPDRDVARSYTGDGAVRTDVGGSVTDDREGTDIRLAGGATLRVRRVLRPAPAEELPQGAVGHVTTAWDAPDGTRVRGLCAVLYDGPRA
ncbi:1,4-alpha-glucan branching protein [Streptomyces sp. RFCAC02]|uniref:maltokinase N-terminal cap-like domain-containing protein n=1 Tax=Streptomyces sp. RFCAC02 TaxID=2499143 RepID=UPI00101FD0A2|nr:1,4-alpha-glucan branching protein [Streptomyces sp. RFCAC02]